MLIIHSNCFEFPRLVLKTDIIKVWLFGNLVKKFTYRKLPCSASSVTNKKTQKISFDHKLINLGLNKINFLTINNKYPLFYMPKTGINEVDNK